MSHQNNIINLMEIELNKLIENKIMYLKSKNIKYAYQNQGKQRKIIEQKANNEKWDENTKKNILAELRLLNREIHIQQQLISTKRTENTLCNYSMKTPNTYNNLGDICDNCYSSTIRTSNVYNHCDDCLGI